jgi:hypothetical protein
VEPPELEPAELMEHMELFLEPSEEGEEGGVWNITPPDTDLMSLNTCQLIIFEKINDLSNGIIPVMNYRTCTRYDKCKILFCSFNDISISMKSKRSAFGFYRYHSFSHKKRNHCDD